MADSYTELADTCLQIIQDPAPNISKIGSLLKTTKDRNTLMLSLVKVFKHIVPLYKIRVHSGKVKHRNGELTVTPFDKELVGYYNEYIKELCSADSSDSFRSASELLKSLDHFNFADRVVSKVLLGTRLNSVIGTMCVDALVDRIKYDEVGETIFMIINQCLDYKHSHVIVEALLESKYLEKCVVIRTDKEEKYNKKYNEEKRRENKVKKKEGIFKKAPIYSKSARKEEKKRLAIQSAVKREEESGLAGIDDKNYVKTVNALQRLYFTILKEKVNLCYRSVFIGIRKYIKLIRMEFREGLSVLLHDSIADASPSDKLEGVVAVTSIYANGGVDLKRIINTVFVMLHPLGSELSLVDYGCIKAVIKQLFIETRQSGARVNALIQRLMQVRLVRYVKECDEIIKMLETVYDVDFNDVDF
ncbi:nucleolar complex protein 3, partial [Pancytospora epiphaga]